MRKVLFILIIILLLIFTGFTIYKGTNFANLDVWGVTQISQKNADIDQANANLSNLVSTTYPAAVSKLSNSSETLQETKKEYEDKAVLLSDSKYYKQTEKYELEFLWTKIGNYARENKVVPTLKVVTTGTKDIYDLDFTATGRYANVADFIYDIENDSKLGFKIENFKMTAITSEGENQVQGTFSCKDIRIDIKGVDEGGSDNTQVNTSENDNSSRTTNTTNNTTNTTSTNATTNNTTTENTTTNTVANTTTESNQTTNSATGNTNSQQ